MKPRHTPGPWDVSTGPTTIAVVRVTPDGGGLVAEIGMRRVEAIANAELIAAAPEMYRALVLLLAARAEWEMGFAKGLANEALKKAGF